MSDFDLDLWVALTFKQVLMEYQCTEEKIKYNIIFHSFDLSIDPVTLILKFDLNIIKIYLCTKNGVPSYGGSKVIAWTDRHTESNDYY